MELERLRATTVTQAQIARESAQQKADADLYTQTKKSDAHQYNQKTEAEAVYYRSAKDADAAMYKVERDASAQLMAKEKEAQAYYLMKEQEASAMYLMRQKEAEATYLQKEREAQANYILAERAAEASYLTRKREADGLTEMAKAYGQLSNVLGGPQGLMQYLMLQSGQYEKLALANAKAINGLQPKINVWNTGSMGGEGAADPTAPIRNLFQCLPPMLSTIQDQTGMQPPSWLARMPEQGVREMTAEEKEERARARKNGVFNGVGNGYTS